MTVNGSVGTSRLIAFIKRLLHGIGRMIFLIVDRHPAHQARKVARFIETEAIAKRFRLSSALLSGARVSMSGSGMT
jgi:hypothetical protein